MHWFQETASIFKSVDLRNLFIWLHWFSTGCKLSYIPFLMDTQRYTHFKWAHNIEISCQHRCNIALMLSLSALWVYTLKIINFSATIFHPAVFRNRLGLNCFHFGVRNHFLIPQSHKIQDSIDETIFRLFYVSQGLLFCFLGSVPTGYRI